MYNKKNIKEIVCMLTKQYTEFLKPYRKTVEELGLLLESLKGMGSSTICLVEKRVKSLDSIQEKCRKQGIEPTSLCDIAGVRVVCSCLKGIDEVVRRIRQLACIIVLEENDYITGVKPSGYRSYHIKASYKLEYGDSILSVPCEIQVRTVIMHGWSNLEHSLNYKRGGKVPKDVKDRLERAAQSAYDLDCELDSIRSKIALEQ
jgi:putative GTP pyrophosphokinase